MRARLMRGGAVAFVLAVVLTGCPADDGEPEAVDTGDPAETTDEATAQDDFCSYMAALNDAGSVPDPSSSVWVELYAGAAERAPDEFREAMEAQLALVEAQQEMQGSGGGDEEGDLTGDLDYMELVAATETAAFREATEQLAVYLTEECGIELEEPTIDTVAPFTGTILAPEG